VRLAPIVTIRSLKEDWLQAAEDQEAIFRGNRTTAIEFAEIFIRDNLFCLALLKEKSDEDLTDASATAANQEGTICRQETNRNGIKKQNDKTATLDPDEGEKYVSLERSKANYYFTRAVLPTMFGRLG